MEIKNKNQINTSLIPILSTNIVRVGSVISITNKLLFGDIEHLFNAAFCLLNSKKLANSQVNFCREFETNPIFRKREKFDFKANDNKDYFKAIELFTKVIELKSYHSISYEFRGVAKSELKLIEVSLEDFSKAIEISPENIYAYNYRGCQKSFLKDWKGALIDFTKAIEIDPNYHKPYCNKEICYGNLNDRIGLLNNREACEKNCLNPF